MKGRNLTDDDNCFNEGISYKNGEVESMPKLAREVARTGKVADLSKYHHCFPIGMSREGLHQDNRRRHELVIPAHHNGYENRTV